MLPTPQPQNRQFMSPVHQVTMLQLVAPNGFFPGVVVTCGEEGEPGGSLLERREGRLVFGDVVSGLVEKVMSERVSHWEDSVLTMQ